MRCPSLLELSALLEALSLVLSVVTSSHLLELSAFPQALSLEKSGMINCPMLGLSALLQTLYLPLAQRVVKLSPAGACHLPPGPLE